MSFEIYPALDLRGGGVVRLRQGDYARETRYDGDPVSIAQRLEASGARWLHLVDLDAARGGRYALAPLVRDLRRATGLRLQTGGGLREEADVEAVLAAGAERAVIGSVAVLQPERVIGWLRRFGADRLVVALDARRDARGTWRLPVRGWTHDSGLALDDVLARYRDAGLRHALCTDIERDGMLAGANAALYAHLAAIAPGLRLQASGGAASARDVVEARNAGCAGIVVGRALLDGRLDLRDLLAEAAC